MQGKEVDIEEVLLSRERRANIQNKLIEKYNLPIISFTMNIPGPIKTNEDIRIVFNYGKNLLIEKLKENKLEILEFYEINENTGDVLFVVVKTEEVHKVKDITLSIEENEKVGRIFDMDVIDKDFIKISRKTFRKCFICDKQAQDCGRSRRHSIQELQNKVEEILRIFKNFKIK